MNKVFVATAVFSKITKKKAAADLSTRNMHSETLCIKESFKFLFLPIQDHWSLKSKVWGVILRTKKTTPASKPGFSNPSMKEGPRSRSFPGPKPPPCRNCHDVPKTGELMCQHIRRWVETWPSCQGFWGVGGSSRIDDLGKSVFETVSPWFFWFFDSGLPSSTHGKRSDEYFFAPEK